MAASPSAEQVERMVAAKVKHLAEAEYQRQKSKEEKIVERRDRLRTAYRRYIFRSTDATLTSPSCAGRSRTWRALHLRHGGGFRT